MVQIRYNAKPSLKSKQGWTALDFAQKQNQQDAVLYLQDIMKRQKILTNPGRIQLIQTRFCSGLHQTCTKGGFKSEGRGGFSQLPKMSAKKTYLRFRK